jgi:hypothetical protein
MDLIIQNTQHVILEHPVESAVLCVLSVLVTIAVRWWIY